MKNITRIKQLITKKKVIHLMYKRNLADVLADQSLVSRSIGPHGECIMLAVEESSLPIIRGTDTTPGVGSFPHSQAKQPIHCTISIISDNQIQSITIAALKLAYPLVQLLPRGEILLVGSRCRRLTDGTAELNANIYNSNGELLREMCFGDGIADVQTTSEGNIWVSYFDEGIYGNYGWGNDEASTPIGATGLVEFDSHGQKVRQFEPPPGYPPIDDCYALNLYNDEPWVYYYSAFPIVQLKSNGEANKWSTSIAGAHAFATDGQRVLIYGGYKQDKNLCLFGELGQSSLTHITECNLEYPSKDKSRVTQVIGRGPYLHFFFGTGWYVADVRQ